MENSPNVCSLDNSLKHDNVSHSTDDNISFKISAPGKVILFGEHSVVYGKTALVSALDLRTRVVFEEIQYEDDENEEKMIELWFEDINLGHFLKYEEISNFLEKPLPTVHGSSSFNCERPNEIDHDAHLENIKSFLLSIDERFENCNEIQKNSITVFLYLFVGIYGSLKIVWRPFRVYVNSELTLGAGTGSSASFTVCLTACLLTYLKFIAKRNGSYCSKDGYVPIRIEGNGRENGFSEKELEIISNWSFNGERIYHGNPSGVDNFICTYGYVYEFRKGEKPIICSKKSLSLILINTKVSRNTRTLVEKVAKLKCNHPIITANILNAMDEIAKTALEHLKKTNYAELWELSDMNQKLLEFFGVSHPTLSEIMVILKSYGLKGKLTGAGGGGHAICFVNVNDDLKNNVEEVLNDLRRSGFTATLTRIGLGGVRVD